MSAGDVSGADHAVFDVDAFLARPLTARLATDGPTVRPIWYLWENGAFWWITGDWSRLPARLEADPHVALVVDVHDPATGECRWVIAHGEARLRPYDEARARRKLRRYLGPREDEWGERWTGSPRQGQRFAHLIPHRLLLKDYSYPPPPGAPGQS